MKLFPAFAKYHPAFAEDIIVKLLVLDYNEILLLLASEENAVQRGVYTSEPPWSCWLFVGRVVWRCQSNNVIGRCYVCC